MKRVHVGHFRVKRAHVGHFRVKRVHVGHFRVKRVYVGHFANCLPVKKSQHSLCTITQLAVSEIHTHE